MASNPFDVEAAQIGRDLAELEQSRAQIMAKFSTLLPKSRAEEFDDLIASFLEFHQDGGVSEFTAAFMSADETTFVAPRSAGPLYFESPGASLLSSLKGDMMDPVCEGAKLVHERLTPWKSLMDLQEPDVGFWGKIFGSEHDDYLKEKARLEARLRAIDEKIKRANVAQEELEACIQNFSKLNWSELLGELSELNERIKSTTRLLEETKKKADALSERASDTLDQLRTVDSQLYYANEQLVVAESLSTQLNQANSRRDRAMIHQWSTNELGVGSPNKAANSLRRKIETLKRDQQKLDERLEIIYRDGSMNIKAIVIDGSNLCNDSSNEFIGISPVKALVDALAQKYLVYVLFDYGTTKMPKMRNLNLSEELSAAQSVHITDKRRAADYTFIALAEEPTTYILSKDGLKEFKDSAAMRDGRIIRPEIVAGRAIIHELNINTCY